MSHEREPGHFVLVKPCGGLWVMLPEDRTLIDIDMDPEEMRANFRMNCLPESLLDGDVPPYEEFLSCRRRLMAQKIRDWFSAL